MHEIYFYQTFCILIHPYEEMPAGRGEVGVEEGKGGRERGGRRGERKGDRRGRGEGKMKK